MYTESLSEDPIRTPLYITRARVRTIEFHQCTQNP